MPGKINGRRRRGRQRMGWLDGIIDSMDMSLSKLQEIWKTGKPAMLQLQRVGHNVVTKQQHFIYPSSIYWARQCISRSMYFADNDKIIDKFHWSMTRSMYFTDCKIQILTPHGKKKKLRLFIHSPNNVKHIFSAKYYYRQSLEGIQRWKLPSFI